MTSSATQAIPLICLVATAVIVTSNGAAACTCSEYVSNDIGSKSEQEINAKRFERAENVVRGRFTYISLGPDVRRGFTVKMHVERAIKGNLGGEIELYTGFGNGDCGLVGMVMGRMLHDRPVDIEIRTSPSREDGRMGGIDSCGYIAEPQPSSSSRGARER